MNSIQLILGHPVAVPVGVGPATLSRQRNTIIHAAHALRERGGGLLAISYAEEDLAAVLLLLGLAFRVMRNLGKARIYRPLLDAGLLEDGFADYLVVHDLPRDRDFLELLQSAPTNEQLVIASGRREDWEQVVIPLPLSFLNLSLGQPDSPKFDHAVQYAKEAYDKLDQQGRTAYLTVAFFHAWGVPLLFCLLARFLGKDEDTAAEIIAGAEELGLLCWLETDDAPELLVATASPSVAGAMVAQHRGNIELKQWYTNCIEQVDPTQIVERYQVLKLFHGLHGAGRQWPGVNQSWGITEKHYPWLRQLVEASLDSIKSLYERGDDRECLGWGRFFESLGMHNKADWIFTSGLRKSPDNPFLAQAQARILGRWAQLEPRLYPRAREAFDKAAERFPENAYVRQAWGVMEAQRGNRTAAETHFQRALRVSRRPGDAVYTQGAWTDLLIDAGEYEQAHERLGQIQPDAAERNPYPVHLRGKLAFCRGNYQQAQEHFTGLLTEIDPVNIPALHALGNMALKRGHWKTASYWLNRVLGVDPENIPTLQALGELQAEQGKFEEARDRYLEVLEIEPSNLYARVGLGVLHRRWNQPEPSENYLQDALQRQPGNRHALHALAKLRQSQDKNDEAERLFEDLLWDDRQNLAALLGWAELAARQGNMDASRMRLERVGAVITERQARLPTHELIRVYNTWAVILNLLGEKRSAHDRLQDSLALDEENAYTLRALADAVERLGDKTNAAHYRRKAERLQSRPAAGAG